MQQDSLADLIAAMTPRDAGYDAALTENWMQGRTTYGGLTAAFLLETALRSAPDLPPLRSALIDFTAPVSEPPHLTATILRQGRNITTIESRALSGDQVAGTGNFTFGAGQDSTILVENTAPDAPPPEDTPTMIPEQAEPFVPGFHRNFDMRLIEGSLPFSGATRGYLRGWARHRDPASQNGIVSLLCIGDILPPAVFPLFPKLGPNSSITWMFNVMDPEPKTRDGWWHVESEVTAARDGYSSQVMRVWNTDGQLIADGMQSVIVFV